MEPFNNRETLFSGRLDPKRVPQTDSTKMLHFVIYALQKESDQKITSTVNGGFSTYTQVGLAPGQRYTVTITGEKDGKMGAKTTTTFQTCESERFILFVYK